jgi:hypothetical protein
MCFLETKRSSQTGSFESWAIALHMHTDIDVRLRPILYRCADSTIARCTRAAFASRFSMTAR